MYCINGECLNTDGSYHCFCSLPLVLDATGNRCVNLSGRAGEPRHPFTHPTHSGVTPRGHGREWSRGVWLFLPIARE